MARRKRRTLRVLKQHRPLTVDDLLKMDHLPNVDGLLKPDRLLSVDDLNSNDPLRLDHQRKQNGSSVGERHNSRNPRDRNHRNVRR